ncbi:MAG TPA: hypothetical protein VGO33_04240 [Gemmatimonadaceae bacterium]|nr:hypothetical protein [Gemmatimonadaceae bacterium]
MIVSRTIVASCVAMSALLSACAGRQHANLEDEPEVLQPISGPVVLEVENHNWSDVVLFIIHNGQTHRFAQIAAAKDQSFEIPTRFIGDEGILRVGLHRIGGQDDFRTDAVSVRTGGTIRLTIEGKLEHSSIGVW